MEKTVFEKLTDFNLMLEGYLSRRNDYEKERILDNWGDLQSEICELITENERMENSENERRNKKTH